MPVRTRAARSQLASLLDADAPTVVLQRGDADPTLLFRRRLKAASRATPPPSSSAPSRKQVKNPAPPPSPPRSERPARLDRSEHSERSERSTAPPPPEGDRPSGTRPILRAQAILDARPSIPFEGLRWWLQSRRGTLTARAVVLLVFGGSLGVLTEEIMQRRATDSLLAPQASHVDAAARPAVVVASAPPAPAPASPVDEAPEAPADLATPAPRPVHHHHARRPSEPTASTPSPAARASAILPDDLAAAAEALAKAKQETTLP